METFILICGFIGAWLLFAGPIYQAALELREEDVRSESIAAARQKVGPKQHISAWWWLLPPVKLALERRVGKRYQQSFIGALGPEDIEALVSFMHKATAWLFVGVGGLLIATKETYELIHHLEWDIVWFWVLVVGFAILSLINTAVRISRSEHIAKLSI